MSLSQRTASVPNAFADLDENQQAELLRAPLHERMQQLSKLTNRPLKSVAEKISQEFGIRFVETFKVLENAF